MSDEEIEELISWNLSFNIQQIDTIKELQYLGIIIPDYIIEEITHTNDHSL